ncbi:kinesin family member 3 [Heterostelium album PN500]|uniref:Kinesin family member 3 n=1 Tax=Heterostelium pallidum (strain ATCC 26659 / Pp 5 / PN500) TaxID=670386 RepID=D3B313_HETP5|nr:kinesin family member 3 [Heterostelium album PN500]EFA83711.1 kinesin family member 3 [Heterostelium album PN500]|eukprot:XP_020435828.1 kinesin family member 3 [Heterostelium album PN500]
MSSIRVVCRFRPQNKIELAQGGCSVVDVADDQTVTIKGNESNHTFTFDRIYTEKNSQKDVYDDAAKPVIEDIMQGYNGTIFVYGQTSSGKTHTMQGPSIDDAELKGVIPRMINTVFDCITKADENIEFIVKASYIEIYMERIRDLLDVRKDNLKVREEKGKGVWVDGTTEVYIYREDDILEVMRAGQANRAIAETKMNAESSRSHSIFILTIQQKNLKEGSNKSGKLYLVDLAGSEKIAKTGAQGLTLDEAKMINKSLSSLGNVINALTDGKSTHIPYRDSKLTRVLQESLGGNSRTTLIINCSPSSYNETETLSTLRFGNRAKSIKNKAKINQERSAAELKILLSKAEKEIESLKDYIKELETVSGVPHSKIGNNLDTDKSADVQGLKEKCIQLEKLLFQKEEEKKELSEQLDTISIQLQDKEQELETQTHQVTSLKDEASKYVSLSNENDILSAQLTEIKLLLEKKNYESVEQTLVIEELSAENASIKSQLQEKIESSKGVGGIGDHYTPSPPIRSAISEVEKHNDEWAEKEEQLKLLQKTPSKAKQPSKSSPSVLPLSSLSITSNNNSTELIEENELLKKKLEELQSQIDSLNNNNNNNNNQVDSTDNSSKLEELIDDDNNDTTSNPVISLTDVDNNKNNNNSSLDEIPSEMMFQAEQLRKLLNENSEQKSTLDTLKNENKRLNAKLNNIEEEMRQRMEEELNMLREQTNQKLSEFGSLKESLLRDLENRCQKVIDLELVLDEFQDRNATLTERLKRTSKMNGEQENSLVQLKLDEMTSVKHQLSIENNKLKQETQRCNKQLTLRNEHILRLEDTLKESQERFYKLALNHDSLNNELNKYKSMESDKKNPLAPSDGARIVRPLRGGGGGGAAGGPSTPQKQALSSNLYANTNKSSKEVPSPLAISQHAASGSASPNGASSSNPKLTAEKSSSSLWDLFRKKQTSPLQSSSNSNPNTQPSTPGNQSPNGGGGSSTSHSPIPLSLNNSYTPAVPTTPSPSLTSPQQQSPPATPSTSTTPPQSS